MSSVVKPMLAADITEQLDKLRFPVYVTPKLDGVRALCTDQGLMSRTWKRIPNEKLQKRLADRNLAGLDGELIVGSPTAPDVYRVTQGAVARKDGDAEIALYVFDDWNMPGDPYVKRVERFVHGQTNTFLTQHLNIHAVPTYHAFTLKELLIHEAHFLEQGYEGCILRAPRGLYKNGRSTINEQGMLKLKRFVDGEAEIVDMEEEMENANEAKKDAFGRTERSSHKANLKGKGRMGALVVRDLATSVEFRIGTGFDADDRAWFWKDKELILGRKTIVKYKHFAIGAKDKPRFPKYVGLREGWDL